jgi:histidyl-tRNA synthetase
MRILDCKNKECKKIAEEAPIILDYVCDECDEHFEKLKSYLEALGIQYKVDHHIVRGLDYYTRTVFEIINDNITVCGGGRYNGLIEQIVVKILLLLDLEWELRDYFLLWRKIALKYQSQIM